MTIDGLSQGPDPASRPRALLSQMHGRVLSSLKGDAHSPDDIIPGLYALRWIWGGGRGGVRRGTEEKVIVLCLPPALPLAGQHLGYCAYQCSCIESDFFFRNVTSSLFSRWGDSSLKVVGISVVAVWLSDGSGRHDTGRGCRVEWASKQKLSHCHVFVPEIKHICTCYCTIVKMRDLCVGSVLGSECK